MNTHASYKAGVNGWSENKTGQPLASGYQRFAQNSNSQPTFPHSPEIELGVLGCIVLDAPYCFGILEARGIAPAHFYDLRYQALFRLMLKMRKAGEPIDTQTFFLRAQEKGLAKTPEDIHLLTTLADNTPSATHLEWFLPQLIEAQNRRLTLDVSRRLEKVALDASAPVGTLLADAQQAISSLAQHTDREPFTVRSMAELCEQPLPENDNILGDRLLAQGQSLTVLGAGGIGKSRLLLQLAACTIAGRPFFGLPTHAPGTRWLILQAENSNRRLQMDAGGLRSWLGADWPQVAERLWVHTLENNGDPFVSLDSPEACQRIASLIEKLAPDVVCFDPLNCFGQGDLNNDSDMRHTCQAITRISQQSDPRRAVVVLHHALTGRMGAARATGFDRSSFGRNSKLLHAWTRGSINIAPQGPNDNSRLVVSCGKCSNGEEFATFGIRLNRATMTYEADADFNLHDWEAGVQDGRKREPLDELLDLCQAEPCTRPAAVKKLIERGVSRATAYRTLKEAESEMLVTVNASGLLAVEMTAEDQCEGPATVSPQPAPWNAE
jgi:hypothetical protein